MRRRGLLEIWPQLGVSNAKPYQMKAKTNKQHFFLAGQPCIWGGSLYPDDKFSSESDFFIYSKLITLSYIVWVNHEEIS
jgi:hypothetical protein